MLMTPAGAALGRAEAPVPSGAGRARDGVSVA